MPLARGVGCAVAAGSYNLRSAVEVRVQEVGAATRFGQIVALMESASLQKPVWRALADRVARPFWYWCCWQRRWRRCGGGRPIPAMP